LTLLGILGILTVVPEPGFEAPGFLYGFFALLPEGGLGLRELAAGIIAPFCNSYE
jgi:hypothetical protein